MGGRGASSGGGGGGGGTGSLRQLLGAFNDAGGNGAGQVGTGQWNSTLQLAPFQRNGDYTDNNNPDLVKWQGQTDDKSARFLANVDNTTNLSQIQSSTNDSYSFYDFPGQKFISRMGLNAPTQVMSESDFNKYVAQTGATVLYRGWSGKDAVDRFTQSPNSHIGNGINGDGYYYSANRSTAQNYGNYGQKAALSPNARVISIQAVRAATGNASPNLQSALRKAGSRGSRSFGANKGDMQMALKMGYNTIDAGWAVIPLTRDAVVVSDKRNW